MIMPIRAIQLSKIKGRKKLAAETAGEFIFSAPGRDGFPWWR